MLTSAELLHTLTHCVRLLTARQLAGEGCLRLAEKLASAGLLTRCIVRCGPLLVLQAPLASWEPGQLPPHFHTCAYRARIRGRGHVGPTTAFLASNRAAAVMGGRGGPLKNPLQATHDVHVAEVFLVLRRTSPHLASRWVGEDALPRTKRFRREQRPDAAIVDADGRVQQVTEFIGASYGPHRLVAIHQHCAKRGWRYDLW